MISTAISKISVPFAELSLQRSIRKKIHKIKQENHIIERDREMWERQELYRITLICKNKVPYYKELFSKIKFNPEKLLRDKKYFLDIPILTKENLRCHKRRLINQDFSRHNLHERKTNGSTGITTSIFYDQDALDWSSAASFYSQELLGKKLSENEIYITSKDVIANSWGKKISEKAKCITLNRKNIYYESLGEDELDQMLRSLKSSNPKIVLSTPSIFYALARYVENTPYASLSLNKLITTGEVLDPIKKERIESAFNCKVYNRYGNAEVGVIAHDTTSDYLKVLEPMCYTENTEDSQELIVTNLKNNAMPLLRYGTGDKALVSKGSRSCHLKDLKGRIGDTIYLNGNLVPTEFIKDTLFRIADIEDFQIHKNRIDGYVMIIVCKQSKQRYVLEKVNKLWNNQFKVRFTTMKDLTRVGLRRKFSYFIDETI